MKNLKATVAVCIFSLCLFSSCRHQKILEGSDALEYLTDQEMYKNDGVYHHFNPNSTKLFFVKKWNSPAFYSHNGAFNGISYDWKIFKGTAVGDSVYFMEDRSLYSPDFIAFVGDSIVNIECRFAKENVSDDPRNTAWWLSALESEFISEEVNSFLERIAGSDKGEDISQYIQELKKEILAVKGNQKILSYTLLANPGSRNLPESEYANDAIGFEYIAERLAVACSDETAKLKIRVPSLK